MYAQEISASRFVELCLGLVVSEIIILLHAHTHTHTPYFLKSPLTNFSSHHSQFIRDILTVSLSRTETDQPLLSAVLVYQLTK